MHDYLNFDQIVAEMNSELLPEDIEYLSSIDLKDCITLHSTTGQYIRNRYHLWDEENPFTDFKDPMGENHPDQFSMRVIEAVWKIVNEEE